MHRLFKYLISLCLLLLLISHGVIEFGMFELFRADFRAEAARLINEGVSEHNQVVLSFNNNEFKNHETQVDWKNDDEFRFEGKLFDVIRTEIIGDSVFIYCIYDKDDTKLFSVLDNMIEDDKDDPEGTDDFGRILSHYYFCGNFNYNLISPVFENDPITNPEVKPIEGEYLIITPPPRFTV